MRVIGVALLVAGLACAGIAGAAPDRAALPSGAIVVAGRGIEWRQPNGLVPRGIAAFSTRYYGVAIDSAGSIFALGTRPVVYRFDSDGTSHGWFGSFPDGSVPTAIVAHDPDQIYVALSNNGALNEIYRFENTGRSGLPVLVPAEVTSLDVAADGCTLLYSTPAPGLARLNWCTKKRLPNFAESPVVSVVRALPDGTALAVRGSSILRIAEGGSVVRTYAVRGVAAWADLDLTPDGASFWAATIQGRLYRIDLATGRLAQAPVQAGPGVLALAVQGAPWGKVAAGSGPPPGTGFSLDGVSTLAGEGLSAVTSAPQTSPVSCSTSAPADLTFTAFGQAIGPYEGPFEAKLAATVGPQNVPATSGILGVDVGRLTAAQGTFTLGGAAKGTFGLPGDATGVCLIFQNQKFPGSKTVPASISLDGYYLNARGARLPYRAEIAHGGTVVVDEGVTTLFTDQFRYSERNGTPGANGSGAHWSQSFASDRLTVGDRFTAAGQSRPHTAGIPATAKVVKVAVRWDSPRNSFTIEKVALVPGRTTSSAGKLKPGKLKITIARTPTSVTATVSNLAAGKLRFSVSARKVGAAGTVKTSVGRR